MSKTDPLSIPHISESEIENANKLMLVYKATGADSLSSKIIKISAFAISSSLVGMKNHCKQYNSGFPLAWKLAKVIPVCKGKGSKSNMNNYRPISVLLLLSKIFEKHIHTGIYKHLNDNSLLYNSQSRFCKAFFTEAALIRVTEQLLWNLVNDQVNGLVFIDYKKAYDHMYRS